MEGGQNADTGIITQGENIYRVTDGHIRDGEIWYEIAGDKMPSLGACSTRIDWNHRFDRMQHHTGEHIISGLVCSKYGYSNTSFHLSDDKLVTLAFDGKLSHAQAMEIERWANQVIYLNLPVWDAYPTKEELDKLTYRSKIEIEGQVRIISVGEGENTVDICACCAPHVSRTGEIGIIKILLVEAYKGGTQLGILCGRRALEYISKEHEMIDEIARGFSSAIMDLPALIESQRRELFWLTERVEKLTNSIIDTQIENLSEKENAVLILKDLTAASKKYAYNMLKEAKKGYVGIFSGDDSEGYTYFAGSATKDVDVLNKAMRERLCAKGGGNKEMIQGKTTAKAKEIVNFFNDL